MRMYFAGTLVALLVSSAFGQPNNTEAVVVGPWTIVATYKADKFENCTMSRDGDEVKVSFVLMKDEMLLELESPKWHLERGKTYPVKLAIGPRSYDANVLAATKVATVALTDRSLNEALKLGALLDVQGEGATIRVPLDGSSAAFDRLNSCFAKNLHGGLETNPFVSPSRKP